KPPGSFQDRSRGGREKYAAATSGRACNAGPGRWKRRDARGRPAALGASPGPCGKSGTLGAGPVGRPARDGGAAADEGDRRAPRCGSAVGRLGGVLRGLLLLVALLAAAVGAGAGAGGSPGGGHLGLGGGVDRGRLLALRLPAGRREVELLDHELEDEVVQEEV